MHLGERLTDLIDGRLDAASAAEGGRHLAECAACRAELDALRATRSLIRRAEPPAPRAAFWHRLETRLAHERARRHRQWLPRILIPTTIAAGLAAGLAALPVASIPLPVEEYVHEHAHFRTLHPLADQAAVILIGTDASLRLDSFILRP